MALNILINIIFIINIYYISIIKINRLLARILYMHCVTLPVVIYIYIYIYIYIKMFLVLAVPSN